MASSQIVDFSNVKDQGNFNTKRIPAGDYLATITKIEDAKAKDDIFQYLVSIKINKHSQTVLPYYCKLQENQLWKLRNLLIAAGLVVPKKKMKVDVNRLVNKVIGVTVEDDEFEGKEKSIISAVFPAAELADQVDIDDVSDDDEDEEQEDDLDLNDEAEEEAEDDEAEDEEEEEESGDEFDAMDRNELKAALKKRDAAFQARKSQTDDDLRTLLREAPAKPKAAAKPAAKPAAAAKKPAAKKKPAELSDDDLDELDLDSL